MQMQVPKIQAYRIIDARILIVDDKGQCWLYWGLDERQLSHIGKKIKALNCFRSYDLCGMHLKRPHLTCLTCELKDIINLKKPVLYKIHVHQLFIEKDAQGPKQFLISTLISIVETLTKI